MLHLKALKGYIFSVLQESLVLFCASDTNDKATYFLHVFRKNGRIVKHVPNASNISEQRKTVQSVIYLTGPQAKM